MLASLSLIFIVGLAMGAICQKLKLPRIIGILVTRIVLGPYVLDAVSPAVVIPVYSGPRMLMTRNLIYTAVTRARACVCLVGIPEMLQAMVDNEVEQRRYTGLKIRIQEVMQSEL